MPSISQKFSALNQILLRNLDFFQPGPVATIDFTLKPPFIKDCYDKIAAAKQYHPSVYWHGYIDPLLENLERIIEHLLPAHDPPSGLDQPKYAYLTLLVNAAIGPTQKPIDSFLAPVQGIVNEMYGSFLIKRAQLEVKTPLDQEIPPLVGFVAPFVPKFSKQAPMPSTFELEQMQGNDYLGPEAKDFRAGAVVLPAGYYNVPLLWGVVGHEVLGHYMLSACKEDSLLKELQAKVYDKVLEHFSKEVAVLWLWWSEEAASDVCGVLSLGPSFGVGAISFYTAQLFLGKWSFDKGKLQHTYGEANKQHPIQVLIPYLISGGIEGLKGLSPSRKYRYMAQLEEIGASFSAKNDSVTFPDDLTLSDKDGCPVKIPKSLPLKIMQESARLVGRYIATVRLRALRGPLDDPHDLQDITTWREEHEDNALEIADQIKDNLSNSYISLKGKKPTGVELLSGGILAVIRNPDLYHKTNDVLIRQFGAN